METPDISQSELPEEGLLQPPEQPALSKTPKLPIILIALFLLFLAGVGAYFLGFKGKQISNPSQVESPTTPNPVQNTPVKIAGWNTFNHPSGSYSFQYPNEVEIKEGSREVIASFPSKDEANNRGQFVVEKVTSRNIYNRPFDRYVREYTADAPMSERVTINGLSAWKLIDRLGNDTEQIFIQNGDDIYEVRLYNYGAVEQNAQTFKTILTTFTFQQPIKVSSEVKVIDGDIDMVINGGETKITDWGYNSSPFLSPDKSKVAYISLSAESIENEKNDQGYKRTSTNVWIVNTDGTNPIQLTKHGHYVYRSNLHWLDNDNLMFMDGEETARAYTLSTKSFSKIFGPEQLVASCVDACGFVMYHNYSPDFGYLVSMVLGYGDRKIQVANTKTLTAFELENPYTSCINSEEIKFSNDNKSLIFSSNTDANSCSGKAIEVNLNLETQKITTQ